MNTQMLDRRNRIVLGGYGSGKSFAVQQLAYEHIQKGHGVAIIGSPSEYVQCAALAPRCQATNPAHMLINGNDPFTGFAEPADRALYAADALVMLMGLQGAEADLFRQVVDYEIRIKSGNIAGVVKALKQQHRHRETAKRAGMLGELLKYPIDSADLIIDSSADNIADSGAVMLIDTYGIEFRTPDDSLVQAAAYLAVALAREFCTRNSRTVLVVDPVDAIRPHQGAWELLVDQIRHSSERSVEVWMLSAHPDLFSEFDGPFLDCYVPTRMWFRTRLRTENAREVFRRSFCHVTGDSETPSERTLAGLERGDYLARDPAGRVSHVRVQAASDDSHSVELIPIPWDDHSFKKPEVLRN